MKRLTLYLRNQWINPSLHSLVLAFAGGYLFATGLFFLFGHAVRASILAFFS